MLSLRSAPKKVQTVKTLILDRPVIAVTGSAGKTTTKEMIAAILRTRWPILQSKGNMNFINHTRRYAQQVLPRHRALVLEYGMSRPGHIRRHCAIIQPNISVITNIGTAHIGWFGGDPRKLAMAKAELVRYMKPTGTLVINADDENSRWVFQQPFRGRFRGRIITVGIHQPADYVGKNVRYAPGGMRFTVRLNGTDEPFYIPSYGEHQVYNALAAIAVAHHLGFGARHIRAGLRGYLKPRRRLTVYRFAQGLTIIDDSFSANPNAVKAAIDVLSHVRQGTKVAVLGSMLSLGNYARRAHQEVGRYTVRQKVDFLYTYGQLGRIIRDAAVAAGMPATRARHCADMDTLLARLRRHLQPNTTILIKASHAIRLHRLADSLVAEARRRRPAPARR
ncbi:MAG: UDP-N-acetylmuramoyl-tripeptide--D-alanyl-D-alanine ligase [Alicyclobacillaceae bacterium]|nr:UDP-N-acetylmuramoyl-tripeptide--D-alanyl-D-alanine ligase [Alicyclobacillaceae bacterium]